MFTQVVCYLQGVLSTAPINCRFKDRQEDKVIRSPSCEVKKKNLLTSKKFVVQIKQLQKKSVIIQSFRGKKLPKILEIRPIREKTISKKKYIWTSKQFVVQMVLKFYYFIITI